MNTDFNLSIELPTRNFLSIKAQGVVLPAVKADIEVLPDRAPSVFVLDYGLLQIVSAKGEVLQQYFTYPGVADVANNECKVMIQGALSYNDINIQSAKDCLANAKDENERIFYQMIVDHLLGVRLRYLRTLNVFSRKGNKWVFRRNRKGNTDTLTEED